MKLSFKKNRRPGGLMGVGYHESVIIKADAKEIGLIDETKSGKWTVRFMVEKASLFEDGNPNCSWKWIYSSLKFPDEQAARAFLKHKWKDLQVAHKFHQHKD